MPPVPKIFSPVSTEVWHCFFENVGKLTRIYNRYHLSFLPKTCQHLRESWSMRRNEIGGRRNRRRGKQRIWSRRKETIKKMQERSRNLLSVWHPLWHTSPVCIASGGSSPAGHTCETNIALLHSGNTEWETKKRMKQLHWHWRQLEAYCDKLTVFPMFRRPTLPLPKISCSFCKTWETSLIFFSPKWLP